jgi:hypothetical protein
MGELCGCCVKTYDLVAEQVKANSLGRVDTVFSHSRTRMGERVDRLHYRFIEDAKHMG